MLTQTFNRTNRCIITVFILLFTLTGCASFKAKPTDLILRIKAAADLNPDIDNRPSPVVLKLLVLKEATIFENARFFELWENAQDTLGEQLVFSQELELFPNSTHTTGTIELPMDAEYIGVIAGYRFLDKSKWRAMYKLNEDKKLYLNVYLNSLAIELQKGKKKDNF